MHDSDDSRLLSSRCLLAPLVPPAAAGVVRAQRPKAAVAAKPRSLRGLGERDHAPADAGGNGGRLLRPLPAAFPTIEALAAADEHEVLRLWEGLGYYRRARQLHQAAKIIVAEHGGRFPRDPEIVRRLPGIGRYTAGAILSIAFDAREPILEANTLRLLSRLLAYDGDPRSAEGQRILWAMAEAVLPRRGCGPLEPGADGIGQRSLHGAAPRCEACPVAVAVPGEPARPATGNPAAEGEAADRGGARGGRAGPPPRPRVAAPLAGRPPLGRAVGFPAIPAPRPTAPRPFAASWPKTSWR